jgi:low affinity Fe/Cu permease
MGEEKQREIASQGDRLPAAFSSTVQSAQQKPSADAWNKASAQRLLGKLNAEARQMDSILFRAAEFLSMPPGFYLVIVLLAGCTLLVPLGLTDVVTYALSVAAIVITGVVLIQGFRDTAAIHAKLDEIIVALRETRNDVVGLEHAEPKAIEEAVEKLEREALADREE